MKTNNLLPGPCPLCRSTNLRVEQYGIGCRDCGIWLGDSTVVRNKYKTFLNAWNQNIEKELTTKKNKNIPLSFEEYLALPENIRFGILQKINKTYQLVQTNILLGECLNFLKEVGHGPACDAWSRNRDVKCDCDIPKLIKRVQLQLNNM